MPNPVGKRFNCSVCNSEVLITKAGDGSLECCGQPMTLQEAKALPSSD
ncbi:MAG: desulforedoxin [Chloroflexota bacterium]|nr:desulforedoxin [Chloroflexota bacterium]